MSIFCLKCIDSCVVQIEANLMEKMKTVTDGSEDSIIFEKSIFEYEEELCTFKTALAAKILQKSLKVCAFNFPFRLFTMSKQLVFL